MLDGEGFRCIIMVHVSNGHTAAGDLCEGARAGAFPVVFFV